MVKVKIYTTTTCPYCKITRSFYSRDVLQKLNINFGGVINYEY